MTNQNDTQECICAEINARNCPVHQGDTQDEAELLACKYSTEVIMNNPSLKFDGASVKTGYRAGYRAGVATVADKHLELATKYSDLAGKYEKLVEHRNRILDGGLDRMTERDEACAELATSRAEVEQLNKLLKLAMNERRYYYDLLEEEKAKAQKLVGLLREAVEFMKRPPAISTGDRAWHQQDVIIQIDKTISDYSTDSGDGVG